MGKACRLRGEAVYAASYACCASPLQQEVYTLCRYNEMRRLSLLMKLFRVYVRVQSVTVESIQLSILIGSQEALRIQR